MQKESIFGTSRFSLALAMWSVLYSCQLGSWKKAQWNPSTIFVTGSNSACRGPSTATCPAGTKLTGGGHTFTGSCGCSEDQRFPVHSYPNNNSWISVLECSTNQAWAICAQ